MAGRIRSFLKEVAARIGLVPFNPMETLTGSIRKDERRRRKKPPGPR